MFHVMKGDITMAEQKRDYYEVLGVDKNADEAAIKKAYRVLAKKLDYEVIEPFQNLVAAAKDNEEAIDIKGVWFEEEYLRYYPLGSVACDAIGYTNAGNLG